MKGKEFFHEGKIASASSSPDDCAARRKNSPCLQLMNSEP